MYLEQACLRGTGEISTLFHGLLPDVIYFVLTLYKCNEMAIFFPLYLVHLLASEEVLLCGWHCWKQAIKPLWRSHVYDIPTDVLIHFSQFWRRHKAGGGKKAILWRSHPMILWFCGSDCLNLGASEPRVMHNNLQSWNQKGWKRPLVISPAIQPSTHPSHIQ